MFVGLASESGGIMKKFKALCLCVFLAFVFTACDSNKEETNDVEETMVVVQDEFTSRKGDPNIFIIVHKETKVQYLFVKHGYGAGLTIMVDESGKPLLYEGDVE